ncbi:hypothetical protein WR25_02475 [Diploscapter pachys]|uniref:Uncharacterized protein n=1 Tax=Diploscapter pachys TaxID=2018661 RepID=A0A2A2M4X9_9BILA|nr:hypothetical protein WR25_02475 [Diploscapter pachys]
MPTRNGERMLCRKYSSTAITRAAPSQIQRRMSVIRATPYQRKRRPSNGVAPVVGGGVPVSPCALGAGVAAAGSAGSSCSLARPSWARNCSRLPLTW